MEKKDDPTVRRVTKDLPVKLTTNEIMSYARELAAQHATKSVITSRRSNLVSQIKAELDECEARISDLSAKVSSGEELRPVACTLKMDFLNNSAETTRDDTGETIARRPLTPEEMQQELPDLSPASTLESEDHPK